LVYFSVNNNYFISLFKSNLLNSIDLILAKSHIKTYLKEKSFNRYTFAKKYIYNAHSFKYRNSAMTSFIISMNDSCKAENINSFSTLLSAKECIEPKSNAKCHDSLLGFLTSCAIHLNHELESRSWLNNTNNKSELPKGTYFYE